MTDTMKSHKVARVLSGKPLKYSCSLYKKDGSTFEFQADERPKIEYNPQTRTTLLVWGAYDSTPICSWHEVAALFCEPNPGAEETT